MALSLFLFYGYNFLAKKNGLLYQVQVVVLIPLASFVYYSFKVASSDWMGRIMEWSWVRVTVLAVGGLSLEMYLCGGGASRLVPANWPVISYILGFIAALMFSYLVRCAGRLFAQTFMTNSTPDGGYNWREIFKV